MMRDLAITLYLMAFRFIFTLFNLLPIKDKITFVVSFGDNTQYIYEEMRRQNVQSDVVFLCKGKSLDLFSEYESAKLVPFETYNLVDWLKSVYHIATSRQTIVDNYFGFLAAIKLKDEVECIQLWHATGAIKKFGLQDASVKYRSESAQQRFKKVYNRFDKVIVGSDIMANIFMDAFGIEENKILRTGIPRTDFFFDGKSMKQSKQMLISENKVLAEKKVILYAPTYRDNELDQFKLQLELNKMEQELGSEYVLVLRLHPAVKNNVDYTSMFPGFVFDYSSSEYEINDLLILADILISDYSSIPYEFSLLKKPMIFFMYDFEQYKKERGIWTGMVEEFPGPLVKDTDSIVDLIKKNEFNVGLIDSYSKKWNKYSRGRSSLNFVEYLLDQKENVSQKQRAL